jgi:hypothetical protein
MQERNRYGKSGGGHFVRKTQGHRLVVGHRPLSRQ